MSINRRMDKYTYTMEYYSVIIKNEMLIDATTQVNLKIIALTETI